MFKFSENVSKNYELIKDEFLKDLNSTGLLIKHKKSGARVVVLSNDDDNKVFTIGFRTPATDDTGTQHIIEHSVLCGSKKYPVKDPFVELCKGSLNTFLNAMTYPDKTVYPVASCNMADFKNIMDVYMDAVFNPNIYARPEIFKQEGWHYSLEDKDADMEYVGVVYNEMKGVYSSPDEVLSRYSFTSLYPDTCYANESGGDPEVIPSLTYENFLKYHSEYYHPSNSYIYLYGDMDVNERLEYLDNEYLCNYDILDKDTTIGEQKGFDAPVDITREFAVTPEEPLEDNTYLSYNWSVGKVTDPKLYLAMQIIDFCLVASTGGKVKEALIKKGIGSDVDSSYESSIYQPMYSITVRNASENQKEEFVSTIMETLKDIVKNGLEKDELLAALNYYEFRYREADFGPYPKGLMYGLQAFDSWLYDENEPFMHIEAGETFAFLRENCENGYFEKLIKEYLIDNKHASIITLIPKVGLTEAKEEAEAKTLADYKATLSEAELENIVKDTEDLAKYQDEPSPQEDLEKIPMLTLEDLNKKAAPLINDERDCAGRPVVFHDIFTNKINYALFAFDCKNVPEELIPYIGIYTSVVGEMDTENYTYAQLSNAININTGGITTTAAIYTDAIDLDAYTIMLEAKTKVLYDKTPVALELMKEILFKTKFEDFTRLKELISRIKARIESSMTSAGHSVAMMQAMAQFSPTGYYSNKVRGYDFYNTIEMLDAEFDEHKEEIAANLRKIASLVLCKDNLTVSFTSDEEGYSAAKDSLTAFVSELKDSAASVAVREFKPSYERLGLTSSAQVQYVARCGNYNKDGFKYTGALKVLKVIFSYEYLWINIRVKGGAYGCMSGFYRNGDVYFVSYRDPNLSKTNKIYEEAPEYIKNFTVSDRDMLKYIIGTIGDMDSPLNPSAKGMRSFSAYVSRATIEDLQRERDEVLGANQDAIRALAPMIESVVKQNYFCVVGNQKQIQTDGELFDKIENLVK